MPIVTAMATAKSIGVLGEEVLSESLIHAVAVLIACCWSGLELAFRRGDAAAALAKRCLQHKRIGDS